MQMAEKNTGWKLAANGIQQGLNGLSNIHSAQNGAQRAQAIAQIGAMIAGMI